jgi:hypothetical protein
MKIVSVLFLLALLACKAPDEVRACEGCVVVPGCAFQYVSTKYSQPGQMLCCNAGGAYRWDWPNEAGACPPDPLQVAFQWQLHRLGELTDWGQEAGVLEPALDRVREGGR